MKKCVRFLVVILTLAMVAMTANADTTDSAERDFANLPHDGVDWVEINFKELQEQISELLGYTPIFHYNSNHTGYGVWEICLPDESIQRMTFFSFNPDVLDSGKHWMSGEDVNKLLGGELDQYVAPLKNKLLTMYPNKDSECNVLNYQYEDIIIFQDEAGFSYIQLETGATEFVRELEYFRLLPSGIALVDGNEVAQAVYDAWATWHVRGDH